MEVKVVQTSSPHAFEEELNALLQDGWRLHGSPVMERAADPDLGEFVFLQVLVKGEAPPPDDYVAIPLVKMRDLDE